MMMSNTTLTTQHGEKHVDDEDDAGFEQSLTIKLNDYENGY